MADLVAIGELLIDFVAKDQDNQQVYMPNPGGAPCNFLTMASKLDVSTAFIGKVGDDDFGMTLKNTLIGHGISTDNLILSNKYNTTLAFVHLDKSGDRSFSFYRDGCADVMLEEEDIDFELIKGAKAFHLGSLSFTNEPSRSAVYAALECAVASKCLISYDPNYRPALWENETVAIKYMLSAFKYADIIKVSDEELLLLSTIEDLELACKSLMSEKTKLICVTLGEAGVYYYSKNFSGYVRGVASKVIDTTGAGDTFFGAFIGQLIKNTVDLKDLDQSRLEDYLKYSNIAASICIESYGGMPSIPDHEAVIKKIDSLNL